MEKLLERKKEKARITLGFDGTKKFINKAIDRVVDLVPYNESTLENLFETQQSTKKEQPIDFTKLLIISFYGPLFILWFVDTYVLQNYKGGLLGFIADMFEVIDYGRKFM